MRATRKNCQANNEQPRRPHPYLLRQISAAASDSVSYTLLSFRAELRISGAAETAKNRIRNKITIKNKIDYGAEASGFAIFLILLDRTQGARLSVLQSRAKADPPKPPPPMEVALFSPRHYA